MWGKRAYNQSVFMTAMHAISIIGPAPATSPSYDHPHHPHLIYSISSSLIISRLPARSVVILARHLRLLLLLLLLLTTAHQHYTHHLIIPGDHAVRLVDAATARDLIRGQSSLWELPDVVCMSSKLNNIQHMRTIFDQFIMQYN